MNPFYSYGFGDFTRQIILFFMKAQFEESDNRSPLEKYTINLTEMAKQGKIDPVIGREDEIYRTIQILSRRSKNNPCLVGDPGVGKTAIVE